MASIPVDDGEPVSSKAGAGRGASAMTGSGALVKASLWATLVLLAVAPWPLGSNRALPLALLSCAAALPLLLLTVPLATGRLRVPKLGVGLGLSGALTVAVLVWGWLQAQPLPDTPLPEAWAHPAWAMLAAEGIEASPRVALAADLWLEPWLRVAASGALFAACFLLAASRQRASLLTRCVVAVGAATAIWALLRQVFGFGLPFGAESSQGFTGPFVNRNHFALYLNIGLAVALAMMVEPLLDGRIDPQAPWRRRVAVAIDAVVERRRFAAICAGLMLAGLGGTLSRGGVVSFAGMLLVFFVVVARTGLLTRKRGGEGAERSAAPLGGWLRATFVALALALPVAWVGGAALQERFEGTPRELVRDDEAGGRLAIWQITGEAFLQRPWLGHGWGTHERLFEANRDLRFPGGTADHAHNDYLETLAELGLPAASALFAAWLLVAGRCFAGTTRRRRAVVFPLAASAASVAVAVHSLVDFGLTIPAVSFAYAAVLGVGAAQAHRPEAG